MRGATLVAPLALLLLTAPALASASAPDALTYHTESEACRLAGAADLPPMVCSAAQGGEVGLAGCMDDATCVVKAEVDALGRGPPGVGTLKVEVLWTGGGTTLCTETGLGAAAAEVRCVVFAFLILPAVAGGCTDLDVRSTFDTGVVLQGRTVAGFRLCRAADGTPSLAPR